MFTGGFESKRGTNWCYEIFDNGDVIQWHENIVRVTGGWARGGDTCAKRITSECFEAIEARYGFKRNPNRSDAVIITDLSNDELIAKFVSNYKDTITMSRTPENKIRAVFRYVGNDISSIRLFDTMEEADKYISSQFGHWEKLA